MDLSRFHQVFSANLQITEVISFGATPKDIRAGRAEIPPEGARSNLIIEGTISGEINGRWECVDYYRILPNGDGRSHSHGIITTEDGQRISIENTGAMLLQPGGKSGLIRHTMQLYATDPALRWVNREPFFLIGTVNVESYEMTLTAFSAMAEVATQG